MKFIDRSKSNAEKYRLKEELFATENVIPMWVADMDLETPSFVIEAIEQRLKHPVLGYEIMPKSAYESGINWIQQKYNYKTKQEWMFFSPSVVASISLVIRAFTQVGDKVVVQTPVYAKFFKQVQNNGREVVINALKKDVQGDYGFDFEDLKSKIDDKTKLLILCSPANPVGRVWKQEELKELASICLENNILVFSDEVHSDLVYAPHIHTPFASLSKEVENITLTANGVGKTFNLSGLNISTLTIANKTLREKFQKEYDAIHFGEGSCLSHIAHEVAYKNSQEWLDVLLPHLQNNAINLHKMLQKHSDKIEFKIPQGTYLAWLDCNKMNLSDKKLREFFVQKAKLGLSAGISFGREGSGYMRLNFALSHEVMQEAITNLDKALREFTLNE